MTKRHTKPSGPYTSPWVDLDARLRLLWDQGLPVREIGRLLGKTLNAVVGRVHRLHLTPRPSPRNLLPGSYERRATPRKRALIGKGPRAMPSPVPKPSLPTADPAVIVQERRAEGNRRGPLSSTGPVRPATFTRPSIFDEHEPCRCRWPLWGHHEPPGKPQRFCTAERGTGENYCAKHTRLAYTDRTWHNQEDAA